MTPTHFDSELALVEKGKPCWYPALMQIAHRHPSNSFYPLSPHIQIQILPTNLHTFP